MRVPWIGLAFVAECTNAFTPTSRGHRINGRKPYLKKASNTRALQPNSLLRIRTYVQRTPIDDKLEEAPTPSGSAAAWLQTEVLGGIEPSFEVAAICTVYFVQGALGIASLATAFFLKNELGLAPAESAALLGFTSTPWVIKPLYGFLSDAVPLFGYRRRSYLALAGLVGSASWATMGVAAHTPTQACVALTLASLGTAVADVVVDSIVVERARDGGESSDIASEASSNIKSGEDENSTDEGAAGALQSLCWGSASLGSVASAYASGALLTVVPPRTVFEGAALFPLLVAGISLVLEEERVDSARERTLSESSLTTAAGALAEGSSAVAISSPPVDPANTEIAWQAVLKDRSSLIWSALSQKSVWVPVLFLFCWKATPSAGDAFFYFLTGPTDTGALGFGPEFMGRVSLAGALASLGGVVLYQRFLRTLPPQVVLQWTALAALPFGLAQVVLALHWNRAWGLPDEWLAVGDDVALSVLGQVGFMPTLVLAAKLCPPGVEGTLFALLMSTYNGAGILGRELGAGLTSVAGVDSSHFDALPQLLGVCALTSLLPLPFLGILDATAAEGDPPPVE